MHTPILVADDGNIYEVLERFANYDFESSRPEAKFEYFDIGGRFEGALPLKQPRQIRKLFGLLRAGQTMHVSVAKKSEIDQQAFLAELPVAALFFQGQLFECPISADAEAFENWHKEFRRRFAEIPDDTLLQIVDAHS
jgi:hypothetical protein